MNDPVEAPTLDLLEWLAVSDRTHEEAMESWRTSCPKLSVWEDATDHGLSREEKSIGVKSSGIAPLGFAFLQRKTESRL